MKTAALGSSCFHVQIIDQKTETHIRYNNMEWVYI